MTAVRLALPPKLRPVFAGEARYRGAYGGRGSAKTRSFAKMTAVRGYQWSKAGEEGVILGGREFMNSLADSSMEEIKAAIRSEPWLAEHYELGETFIRTKDRRIRYEFVGLRYSLDSIKSKARVKLLWVDEAEKVSETAWSKAIPSVREHDSEVWVTWNPESKRSATHKRFRENPPESAKIVELNWRDNPRFPAVLEAERQEDKAKRPESYEHVWEGDFKAVTVGSYFGPQIAEAKRDGRVGRVSRDPLMATRAYFDIGGTGAKADACAIWIVQFVGREIRVLAYYEAQGQELGEHIAWLREHYPKAEIVLPHDGATNDKVFRVSYESVLRQAGFSVRVIPNAGRGAASQRIEAVRRLLPLCWFNEAATEDGIEVLQAYHEKRDDDRGVGLGPNHDWASHGADAFGLMAMDYEAPSKKPRSYTLPSYGVV